MNSPNWWTTVTVVVLFIGAWQLALTSPIDDNAAQDHRIVGQFFNYTDHIKDRKLNNMLEMTQTFAEQLLDSIPYEDRANTAQMLQEYIDNSDLVRQRNSSLQEKEQLLMDMQQLIATIKSGLAKQENEDKILRRGLLGMFELLARMSIEERRYSNKFSVAAKVLKRNLSEEGVQKYFELLQLLDEIQQQEDIVMREQLFGRFAELRLHFRN